MSAAASLGPGVRREGPAKHPDVRRGKAARAAVIRRRARLAEESLLALKGLAGRALGLEQHAAPLPLFEPMKACFRRFRALETAVPLTCVTPPDGAFMHSFFDIPALSPSGRFLALTRLPFEHRAPLPGDRAEVCVVDLEEETITAVYRTCAWALQLGANIQWHPHSDRYLFCNDVPAAGEAAAAEDGSRDEAGAGGRQSAGDNGGARRGQGVRIDRETKSVRYYAAPFYAIAPDGAFAYGPALDLINRTQQGYGVPEPLFGRRHLHRGAAVDEGLWRTDLESGRCRLFLSVADIVDAQADAAHLRTGFNSLFHTKISPDGARAFQVLRSLDLADAPGLVRSRIVSFELPREDEAGGRNEDGGASRRAPKIHEALSMQAWDRGGHHPSWMPDSRHILMNLVPEDGEEMRFVRFACDGGRIETLCRGTRGSGHPSIDPSGRFLLSDAYLNEGFGRPDGEAPLRLIELESGRERYLAYLDCGVQNLRARRIDPHPVWSRDGRKVVLNTRSGGRRQVVIADLSAFQDN